MVKGTQNGLYWTGHILTGMYQLLAIQKYLGGEWEKDTLQNQFMIEYIVIINQSAGDIELISR